MDRSGLDRILEDEQLNATVAWLLVALVLVAAGRSLWGGDLLWTGFAALVAALAVLPAIVARTPWHTLPWEVVAIAALPVLGRAFLSGSFTGELATYLAVAALALIVAVELHVFTAVEMSPGFAVVFVVIATMATAGLWAIVRWIADLYLGTGFLASQEQLMWEFVASTAVGVLAGVTFEWYVRRRTAIGATVPRDTTPGHAEETGSKPADGEPTDVKRTETEADDVEATGIEAGESLR